MIYSYAYIIPDKKLQIENAIQNPIKNRQTSS